MTDTNATVEGMTIPARIRLMPTVGVSAAVRAMFGSLTRRLSKPPPRTMLYGCMVSLPRELQR